MNARGLIASMVALAAGCAVPGNEADAPAFRVERIELGADGQPYFVRGELGRLPARIADAARASELLAPVLPAIADTLRVPAADLVATSVVHDALGMTHVRLAQHKHGLRVVGGDVVIQIGADGVVRSVYGTARDRDLGPSPSLSAAEAAGLAVAGTEGGVEALQSELAYVISTADGELHLAWEVLVSGAHELPVMDFVYVSALDGRVVDRRPQVFTAKNRVIRDGQSGTFPFNSSVQVAAEGNPPANDAIALAAYNNTGATYDCYQALFQRDSYDNAGATLTSQVHVVFSTGSGGTSGNNAVWYNSPLPQLIPSQMAYGDGDGVTFTPLAQAFDVTAHELTHAVTSATANLAYQNESGALNEGMSDILAAVCEAWRDNAISADTWLVGEDIFTPQVTGDALRYMANPTADAPNLPPALGSSRDYYPERYTGTQDNGGVHINSGIANLAFHLLVVGGKHPRDKTTFMVPGLGMEQAGKIFYRALTMKMTENTNFAQVRMLTEQAAQELYPGPAKTAVGMAWAAVGVGAPPPMDTVPPTVEITAPADGARVTPGFQVQVNANDDQGVLKVELSIDGAVVGTATAAPYTFTTDVNLASGTHTLQATAYDAFNQATDSVTVTLSGGVCTTDDQCDNGETCQSGTCQPRNPGGDDDGGEAGGCCDTGSSGRGATGAFALALVTAFALRRRRPRR